MRILIVKASRILKATFDDGTLRHFPVTLGRNPSDKAVEGDLATPEGEFHVCAKNPRSRYFRSLCLSYPNAEDADRGLAGGLIGPREHRLILRALESGAVPPQHTRLGGEIYIHGNEPGTPAAASTRGCIGLDNGAMLEIYEAAAIGVPVTIVAAEDRAATSADRDAGDRSSRPPRPVQRRRC